MNILSPDEIDLLNKIEEQDEFEIPITSNLIKSLLDKKLIYIWENADYQLFASITRAGRLIN